MPRYPIREPEARPSWATQDNSPDHQLTATAPKHVRLLGVHPVQAESYRPYRASMREIESGNTFKPNTALNTARQILKSDRDFGRWLESRLPWLSQSSSSRFMQLACRFSHPLWVTKLNDLTILPTVLYELASPSVPHSVVHEVLNAA